MNEREKKTVESLQDIVNDKELEKVTLYKLGIQDIEIASNLIEKQAKEIQNLKEIEKSHQEENGKLRVELEQEKEINKEIAIKNHKIKEESNAYGEEIIRLDNELRQEKEKNKELLKEYNKKLQIDWEDAISKDKIKEKIKELDELIKESKDELGTASKEFTIYVYQKDILKQLLEEK